jgi:hypothetical protein
MMMHPVGAEAVSASEAISGLKTLAATGATRVKVNPAATATAASPSLLVDFGEELAGRLVLHGTSGTPVVVTTGESRQECFHAEPALDNSGPTALTLAGTESVGTHYSAFRYALLRFPGHTPATLTAVTLDHKYYPVAYKGSFSCSDPLLTRIWYIGAYTAHNCMQEDIWDAPKRDRGLWCGDLQVTGQTIDDVFADRFLMEQSIRKLREIAQSGRPDTALPTAEINGIPGYTAAWFCELAGFYRHTGDGAFLRSQHEKIVSLLEFQKTDFDSHYLFTNPRNDWDFCDWAPDFIQHTPQTRATTDLYIIKGVREAVFLLRALGDTANAKNYADWADELTAAARQNLVDPSGLYSDLLQENTMAVYSGVATSSQQADIYDSVLKQGSTTWAAPRAIANLDSELMSPYYGYFVLGAYRDLGREQDGLDLIRRYWGGMVKRGAVTWWEKFDPAFPKDFALVLDKMPYLSLSHGWSSGPTSFLTESILGVRPISGGFKTVMIAPHLCDLKWASGGVPTPHGLIHVRVERQGAGTALTLTLPPKEDALVEVSGLTARVNGRSVKSICGGDVSYIPEDHAGRYVIVDAATRRQTTPIPGISKGAAAEPRRKAGLQTTANGKPAIDPSASFMGLPASVVCVLPIFNKVSNIDQGVFTDADLQAEMTKLKQQIGQDGPRIRVGFSHIFGGIKPLRAHCRLAKANNLSVGVIIGVQTHSGSCRDLVMRDFRRMQWRLDGRTWQGQQVVSKSGSPEFPARDWHVPTPSRYCPAIHDAEMAEARRDAMQIRTVMNEYPGGIVAVNATIEEELATGGESNDDYLADYSPFAVTEFRDWLRHTGKYDDTSGEYAGQGAPAEIVGPFVKIKGALRSPFYDDPTPDDANGTGQSFDSRFGTHFTTWTLRYWDITRFPDPITDLNFSPSPQSGKGFTEGGFDAPRVRLPADPYWRAWSWDVPDQGGQYPPGSPEHPAFGFRQFEDQHFVSDVLDQAARAGIPVHMLYAHQIAAEQVSPGRCRSGADPAWTGFYAPAGTLGITRFGPIDVAKLTQYSHNWGIFEWHPRPGSKPDDPQLYSATKMALDAYSQAGGHVFFAGWWRANGEIDPTFPLNGSQFAKALHDWLAVWK